MDRVNVDGRGLELVVGGNKCANWYGWTEEGR